MNIIRKSFECMHRNKIQKIKTPYNCCLINCRFLISGPAITTQLFAAVALVYYKYWVQNQADGSYKLQHSTTLDSCNYEI